MGDTLSKAAGLLMQRKYTGYQLDLPITEAILEKTHALNTYSH
jgi:hypothetical protein